jgi:hypothetical protein
MLVAHKSCPEYVYVYSWLFASVDFEVIIHKIIHIMPSHYIL